MVRWIRVLRAVRQLVQVVANADEDSKITAAEQKAILTAMWAVVRAYRGSHLRPS